MLVAITETEFDMGEGSGSENVFQEIRERLIRIEEQTKALADHETRIRALEAWRWGLLGVSGLMTTGFTFYTATKGGA